VARTLVLTHTFLRARARLGIDPATPRGVALAKVLRALESDAQLPGPGDVVATIPPTSIALVRRVPGRNLWVWYRVEGERLFLRHVSAEPPVPVYE
jgi:hypothetical protein